MNRTKIEWCDYTWNPIVGCSPASEGCANCYAAAISKRFGLPWGKPVFMPERLDGPAAVKTPSHVFVCSVSDIGHPRVLSEWRWRIWEAMERAPWHQYILLSKRPHHLISPLIPAGTWLGVTIESMDYLRRWAYLREYWSGLAFVSVEPMLGPVTFQGCAPIPDWVIAGPETGPKARPCHDGWIDALAAESPCFFDKRKGEGRRREWPS